MGIPGSAAPLLLTSAAAAAGGYEIERSVRFNSSDSAYLSRTPSTAGNRKTWTWAGWVKPTKLGTYRGILEGYTGTPAFANRTSILLGNLDQIDVLFDNGSSGRITTTAVFRDPSAWYHIVFACDTTQATASNRFKLYVNGGQVTVFSTASYPAQNYDTGINTTQPYYMGRVVDPLYADFYLADIHFIDGQALDPTSFGEFDDNGIWQPIAYSGSYGTNGFHLDFADNSAATATALGADSSGNGNNWTPNNLLTRTDRVLPGVYFDGSGDYLDVAHNADLTPSGDFTIEFFAYPTSTAGTREWYSKGYGIQLYSLGGNWAVALSSTNDSSYFFNDATAGAMISNQWQHIALTKSGDVYSFFLNGVKTATGTSTSLPSTGTNVLRIGDWSGGIGYGVQGYISNVHFVDGTALYTSNFTPPVGNLSPTANTVLLCCQSSSSATAAAVSPSSITSTGDVFASTRGDNTPGNDSLVDVPTNGTETDTGVGGEVRGNYCTWNLLDAPSTTLSNGNLQASNSIDTSGVTGTIGVSSGKYYWEVTAGSSWDLVGIWSINSRLSSYPGATSDSYSYWAAYGTKFNAAFQTSYGAAYTSGDVIGVALDLDGGTVTFYKNGISQGVAFTGLVGGYRPAARAGNTPTPSNINLNAGQRPFACTAPSGFKALCTANLPTPTIADGSTAMDVVTYTGNGGTQTISGLEFSPDLVWVKSRNSSTWWHVLTDAVRGGGYFLHSNSTSAEDGGGTSLVTGFTSDGFTLNNSPNGTVNNSGDTYVAWAWDAGSSTVTNTDGSITSSVRANPSAGFSIVTYSGTNTVADTVGHGLGVTPSFVIIKNRTNAYSWPVRHVYYASNQNQYLNSDVGTTNVGGTQYGGIGTLSSTTLGFLAGSSNAINVNAASNDYVAYCFAPVEGYSAFGSYTGNGSAADGPFVFTNHRPRWILLKRTDTTSNWTIIDTAREGYNVDNDPLYANLSSAEGTTDLADILSNGFKLRSAGASVNASAGTYIYASFAEQPFALARAR
jgi:hypothetical protein